MLRKRHPNQNADLLLKGIALTVFVSLLLAATVSAEDVDRKTVFEKRCTGCQALDADHEGASPRCGWETRRQYTDLQMCSSSSTKTKGILAVHNFLGSDRAPAIKSIACNRVCGALGDSPSFWNRSGLSQIMALQVASFEVDQRGVNPGRMRRSMITTPKSD